MTGTLRGVCFGAWLTIFSFQLQSTFAIVPGSDLLMVRPTGFFYYMISSHQIYVGRSGR